MNSVQYRTITQPSSSQAAAASSANHQTNGNQLAAAAVTTGSASGSLRGRTTSPATSNQQQQQIQQRVRYASSTRPANAILATVTTQQQQASPIIGSSANHRPLSNSRPLVSTTNNSAYEAQPPPYRSINNYFNNNASNNTPASGGSNRSNSVSRQQSFGDSNNYYVTGSGSGNSHNANSTSTVKTISERYRATEKFSNNIVVNKTPTIHRTPVILSTSNLEDEFGNRVNLNADSYHLESGINPVNKYSTGSQFYPNANTGSTSSAYMSPSLSTASSSSTSNTSLAANAIYRYGAGAKNSSLYNNSLLTREPAITSNGMDNRGIVGLKNLGNTCYMNSILQCLSNTKFLTEYVLSEAYAEDLNTTLSKMRGALFRSYANLIKTMWKESNSGGTVSPFDLKSNISKYAHRFGNYAQEDAEEFFIFLMNGLSDDVNLVKRKATPIKFDEKAWDRMSDAEKSADQWSRFVRLENSKITEMFTGQFRSTLKCTKCDFKSVTFDTFWEVNVPIAKKSSSMRLDDCLRLFVEEEVIDGSEKPMCSKCKGRNVFTKRFTIERLPKILVIHLKRFLFSPYSYKISTDVSYPIEGLDVSKYLSSVVDPSSTPSASATSRKNTNCIYDLYAISLHSGSSQSSGHYYAYGKHPFSNKWHCFNDSMAKPISTASIQDSNAYLLFYQQRA